MQFGENGKVSLLFEIIARTKHLLSKKIFMSKEDLHQLKRDIFQSSPVWWRRRSHHSSKFFFIISCLFHSINFHFFPFSTDSYNMLPSFVVSILREIALVWKRIFSVMLFPQLRERVFIFASSYNSIHCALLIISEKPLVFAQLRLIIRWE